MADCPVSLRRKVIIGMEHDQIPTLDDIEQSTSKGSRNLRARLISGVILGIVTLALIYVGSWPFVLLVICVAAVMSWEWGHIVRDGGVDFSFFVHALAVVAAAICAYAGVAAFGLVALAIGAIIVGVLNSGQGGAISGLGVLYVGVPALALVWTRLDDGFGFLAVLFLFCVVWCNDTAAYVGGKSIGGARLLKSISPNKTWAGAFCGLIGGALAGYVCSLLVEGSSVPYLIVCGVVLAALAQAGDLIESALKRGFNVKDASDLIPGHGGFMDRMDGLVAVAVAAGLWALLVNPVSPARALLFGA